MEKFTKEKYQENLDKIYGKDIYKVLEFNGISNDAIIFHKNCKNSFTINANELTRKRNQKLRIVQCPKCIKYDKYKDPAWLQEQLNISTNNRLTIIDDNPKWREPSKVKCNICNYEWNPTIRLIVGKKRKTDSFGCPRCSGKLQPTPDEYKEFIKKLTNNEYSVISDYKNIETKIKFFHNKCNRDFNMTPNDFHNGNSRCPYCNAERKESYSISFIKNYLNSLNIKFKQEVRFDNCKFKYTLPFDFCIYINDKILLIEYDGEQHFKGWNKNSESKETIKIRDSIKTQFCKENGIPLLRMNYKFSENEIKESIDSFLNENYYIWDL